MNEQIITAPKGDRLVVVSETEYRAMRAALEDREDVAAVRTFERRLAEGREELVPAEFANRLVDGENPVRVWREYRGMKAGELAVLAGISAAYLSEIETGKKEGSLSAMKKIAVALRTDLDDLV